MASLYSYGSVTSQSLHVAAGVSRASYGSAGVCTQPLLWLPAAIYQYVLQSHITLRILLASLILLQLERDSAILKALAETSDVALERNLESTVTQVTTLTSTVDLSSPDVVRMDSLVVLAVLLDSYIGEEA